MGVPRRAASNRKRQIVQTAPSGRTLGGPHDRGLTDKSVDDRPSTGQDLAAVGRAAGSGEDIHGTRTIDSPCRRHRRPAGGALKTAITAAASGDKLNLASGCVYTFAAADN